MINQLHYSGVTAESGAVYASQPSTPPKPPLPLPLARPHRRHPPPLLSTPHPALPPLPSPNVCTNNVRLGSSLNWKHSGGELKRAHDTARKTTILHISRMNVERAHLEEVGGGGTADFRFACFGNLFCDGGFTKRGKEIGNRSGSPMFATTRLGENCGLVGSAEPSRIEPNRYNLAFGVPVAYLRHTFQNGNSRQVDTQWTGLGRETEWEGPR